MESYPTKISRTIQVDYQSYDLNCYDDYVKISEIKAEIL